MDANVHRVASLLRSCAAYVGREPSDRFEASLESRLPVADAALITRGLDEGLLVVVGNYLHTLDPFQDTAWLVEGDPVHPCWEYLPHAATYVQLVAGCAVPASLVRFETPDAEYNLDLAVLDPSGRVVLLGEVKAKTSQLDSLVRLLPEYQDSDPGKPVPAARGGPQGARREAWKLAHQLWVLRPHLLLLAGPADRRAFALFHDRGALHLTAIDVESAFAQLPSVDPNRSTPRIIAVDSAE